MAKIQEYQDLLDAFDSQNLDNVTSRRMAHKPLYDYFQRLLREAGVKNCGLDDNALKNTHLKVRWRHIKSCLKRIENPDKWDALINSMHNIRSKIEHNDYYDPKESSLNEIRGKITEFTSWIINVSEKYYKKSNNFTFKETFFRNLNLYIEKADIILEEYCNDSSKERPIDFSDYCNELSEVMSASINRLNEIRKLEDIQRPDLENLIKMAEITSRFDAKEDVLLELAICPQCGGEIKEIQELTGPTVDSEPHGFYYRVGCQNCGYLLHAEYIDF